MNFIKLQTRKGHERLEKILLRLVKKEKGFKYFDSIDSINDYTEDFSEYITHLKNEYKQIYYNRSDHPFEILEWYAGYYSIVINEFLRGNKSFADTEKISVIERLINKFRIRNNIIVVRIIRNDFLCDLHTDRKINRNTILKDKSFLSTSLFLKYKHGLKIVKNAIILLIKVPAGTNALYIEKLSNRKEYELILQRETMLKVERIKKCHNNTVLLTRIIN
jgi:hypothetical protein